MDNIIVSGINYLLTPFGYFLNKSEREWEREAFAILYETRLQHQASFNAHGAECIVFSKDRALQLHSLLSSYSEKVISPSHLHVLYNTSAQKHQKSYEEVKEIFLNKISFIKQSSDSSFRSDLLKILSSVQTDKIFFLVDDMIFVDNFDINDFTQFDTDQLVPSLRMGLNLKRAYTIQKEQPLPEFISCVKNGKDKIFWRWDNGIYDWSYPLSVDGHFFSTWEIAAMSKLINFSAPNTYEDQLQKFRRFFIFRKGVAYRKSKIINIPCNKVQKENKNICGNTHQDYLLEQWTRGYQMNYRSLYGFCNISAHQEIPFELIKR